VFQLLQLGRSCQTARSVTVRPQTCQDGWLAHKKARKSDEFPDDGEIVGLEKGSKCKAAID